MDQTTTVWSDSDHEDFYQFAKSYKLTESELKEVEERKKNALEIKVRIFCRKKIQDMHDAIRDTVNAKMVELNVASLMKGVIESEQSGAFFTLEIVAAIRLMLREFGYDEDVLNSCAVHFHSQVTGFRAVWMEFIDCKERRRSPIQKVIDPSMNTETILKTILEGVSEFVAQVYMRINDAAFDKYRCHFM